MADFALDTSGVVTIPSGPYAGDWTWDRLTPFAQGYVVAMPWDELARQAKGLFGDQPDWTPPGFSDLSPEALGMILADCDLAVTRRPEWWAVPGINPRDLGRLLWRTRQGLGVPDFPPLTVPLRDDGKIYLQ